MAKKEYSAQELRQMLKAAERAERGSQKNKKEKPPFDRGIVILVFVVNLIVLAASFFVVFKTGVEPSTTVMAWFGFAGAEVWALALLKTTKRKEETKRLKGPFFEADKEEI